MLKAKGKKIYFYFDNAGNNSYTLAASAADGIFLNPMGALNLRGYSKRSLYMKDFFSKFGVEFYNFRSHEYKTAYNNFTEDSMTDAEKEVFEKLYSEFRKKQESMINNGRIGKLDGNIRDIIAGGPYLSSSEAEKRGLVDRLIYKDELKDIYSEMGYLPVKYSSLPGKKNYNWDSLSGRILPVIYAAGDIVPGGGLKGSYIGSDSFVNAVRSARNNPNVKCIIIRINSGGGSAFSSDVIAREIALCRKGDNPKPVIVSMGGVAASGGYYMAAPAEVIFTDEVTVTGSIGVIAMFPDLSGLLSKLGINYESINSSDGSDFGNPLRSMTEDEINKIDDYIAENYKKFIDIVKKYRKLTDEEADAAAQGRVWAGSDAVRLKLADRIGGLKDAVSYAAEKYYKGTEYRVTETVPGNNLFNIPFFMSGFKDGDIKNKTLLTDELEEVLSFYKRIEQYSRGEALFLFPYSDKEAGAAD
jgi:protease-4